MYNKFLFLGLGGSGGKTLRFLKQQIREWLVQHDLPPEMPSGWQFLHIDIPSVPDGDEIDRLADPLSPGEYLGLIAAPVEFHTEQQRLDNEPILREELKSWRIDPADLLLDLTRGAGQYRAVGQSVGMAHAREMYEAMGEKMQALNEPAAREDLARIYQGVFGRAPEKQSDTLDVVVVSSLAGGSGAGLLGIVCDLIRGMQGGRGDNLFAVLYTPEVFSGLTAELRGGVQANSMAAVSELLNGLWYGTSQEAREDPVLKLAGCSTPLNRYGPQYPFLVGKRNAGGVEYGSAEQLFSTVGRSLLSWVTDLAVQARFLAYTTGNWMSAAMGNSVGQDVLVGKGKPSEAALPVFSALGFSRLSVGASYLEHYASEVLARDMHAHMVDYHYASMEAQMLKDETGESDPDLLAEKLAERHFGEFMRRLELEDMWTHLTPATEGKTQRQLAQQVRSACHVGSDSSAPVREWTAAIDEMIGRLLQPEQLPQEYTAAMRECRENWATVTQEKVLRKASEAVTERGLKVARLFVEKAAEHVNTVLVQAAEKELAKEEQWAADWQASAAESSGINKVSGKIGGDDPRLEEYLTSALRFRWRAVSAETVRTADLLLKNLSARMLQALAKRLEQAWHSASSEHTNFPAWSVWPVEDHNIPPMPDPNSAPPVSDFTLIEAGEYKRLLEEKMQESFGDNWRVRARNEAMAGMAEDKGILWASVPWQPGVAGGPTSDPRIETSVARQDLMATAKGLLNKHGSPMERLLNLSLRTSMSVPTLDPAVTYGDRLLAKLPVCLDAAAPLVGIDRAILPQVHARLNESNLYQVHFSSIPFAGHPIEQQVKELLAAKGVSQETLSDLFHADDKLRHMDVTSSLGAPCHPLAFKSLLKPIADDWAFNVGQNAQHLFWRHRRGKTLKRFVPCPQATLLSMTRGWFTALMLGLLHLSPVESEHLKITVQQGWRAESDTRSPAVFPSPLLREPRDWLDYPGVVFESLPLALVDASRQSGLDPLAAYINLRELGTHRDDHLSAYENLNPVLGNWVQKGVLPPGADPSSALLQAGPQATPAERSSELKERVGMMLDEYRTEYQKMQSEWQHTPENLTEAPVWSCMSDVLLRALEQLQQAEPSTLQSRSMMGTAG